MNVNIPIQTQNRTQQGMIDLHTLLGLAVPRLEALCFVHPP